MKGNTALFTRIKFGRCFTLEDVVEYFNLVQQFHLTAEEKADLAAFMRVL